MPSSRSLAPPFLFSLFLSQPLKTCTLGKVHWLEWEGRLRMYKILDCPGFLTNAENEVGSVNSLNTWAFSQSFSSNTISLSKNIIYDAYHRAHIYQSIPYLNDNGQSRWYPGLDGCWKSPSSMDWTDALYYTHSQPEHGMQHCWIRD